MTETKNELGVVKVHKTVLIDIVKVVLSSSDGVRMFQEQNIFSKILHFFQIVSSGVQVHIDQQNQLKLEVNVVVRYGLNVNEQAKQLQNRIKEEILKNMNIQIKTIDVRVRGIERGK